MSHGGVGWIRDRAILAAVLIHVAWALYLSASLSVWTDEGYTLDTTSDGPGRALSQALDFELQPPFYFIVLSVWRLLSHSYLFARVFSVLCTSATIVLIGMQTRERGDRIARALFLILLAIHPFVLGVASEARGYALVMAEVAVTFLAFSMRAPQSGTLIRRVRWPLVAIASIGIYTHYYYGFFLLALGIALLIRRQWRELRTYVAEMVITTLFLSPILAFLPSQIAEHHTYISTKPAFMNAPRTLYWQLQKLLVPIPVIASSRPVVNTMRHVATLAAVAFIVVVMVRRHVFTRRGSSLVPLVTALIVLIFGILRYLISPELLQDRHMTVLFLPLAMTLYLATQEVPVRMSRFVITMALAVAVSASALDLQTRDKSGCLQDVGRFIEIREQPRQPLLVMYSDVVLALREHYHGVNELRGFPRDFRPDSSYLESRAVGNMKDVESTFDRLAPDGTAWFVLYGKDEYLGVRFGRDTLENWIAGNCRILVQNRFCDETEVLLVQRTTSSPPQR